MQAEITNVQRSDRAEETLKEYGRIREGGAPDFVDSPEGDTVDLITDLLHFASRSGLDTERILRMATTHFEAEKGGEKVGD